MSQSDPRARKNDPRTRKDGTCTVYKGRKPSPPKSESQGWAVVVAPRSDVVRLHSKYDDFEFQGLLMSSCEGEGDHGDVFVNGRHIAVAWRFWRYES